MKAFYLIGVVIGLLEVVDTARGQAPPKRRLDSLEAVLRGHPRADTVRVRLLLRTAQAWQPFSPPKALAYAQQAEQLSRKLGSTAGRVAASVVQSRTLCSLNQLGRADSVAQQGLALARATGDSLRTGQLYNVLAIAQAIRGQYEQAAAFFMRTLRLYEYLHLPPARLAAVRDNVGQVLLHIKRYPAAREIFLQNLALDSTKRTVYERMGTLSGLGVAARYMQQYPQAERYFRQLQALARRNHFDSEEAGALANLGFMKSQQGQWAAAEALLGRSVAMARQQDEPQDVAVRLIGWGETLNALKRPTEAAQAANEALGVARKIGAREEIRDGYELLARAYAGQGRTAEAYAALDLHHQWRDSLLTEETSRQVTEMQTKYDTERKEAQNRLQAAQLRTQQQVIRRRNVQLWGGLVVAALLAGLAYLLYNRRRLRREVEFAQERQQLERQRAQAVLEAEEAERRRIGSDLHDGVGQLLTAAKMNLYALGEELGVQTQGQQALLQNALNVVDESFKEVRSISHNLMPNALIKRGLAQAVRDFLDKLPAAGRLKINLEVVGLDRGSRLETTLENVLFRVIQELVQNILKHAQATEVTLQIIRHPDELTVLVEDNGVGFDPAALGGDAGIGLKNIESRMAYLGGRAGFDAAPGRGTTVTLEVPLAAVAA